MWAGVELSPPGPPLRNRPILGACKSRKRSLSLAWFLRQLPTFLILSIKCKHPVPLQKFNLETRASAAQCVASVHPVVVPTQVVADSFLRPGNKL